MLQNIFSDSVQKDLMSFMKISNPMIVPSIKFISVNMGVGSKAVQDAKIIDYALECLSIITGQKPVVTFAKKSISSFKIRQGMPLGCKVTLRNKKLINNFFIKTLIAMSRSRDFLGLKSGQFDGSGNCSFGFRDHTIFPGIDYDTSSVMLGMDINIVTTALNDSIAFDFLSYLGLPFIRRD
ncbi:50S ribosomal protein L5 [Anaplasmataceae bacterium AB001_6]|nr:50S ribosomal protein L5 [Anaplasmataceae bacterium AB001_6]